MSLLLVGICLAAVVGLYYYNNPLSHGSWLMTRRFINWFPLGMSSSAQTIRIAAGMGTTVYGLSFLINGPLVPLPCSGGFWR